MVGLIKSTMSKNEMTASMPIRQKNMAAQPAVFIGKDIPVLLVFVLKLPHVLLTGGVQGFGIIVLHGKQQLHHVGIQQLAVFALQLL